MAKGAGKERSWVLNVLVLNSAVLALLLLGCEFSVFNKHLAVAPTPRVAGARVTELNDETASLSGSGKVVATGQLNIAGSGHYKIISNGSYAFLNGTPLPRGQIVEGTAENLEVVGENIFAEITGTPLALHVTGTGELSSELTSNVEVPAQVTNNGL